MSHQWRFELSRRLRTPHWSQIKTSLLVFLTERMLPIRPISRFWQVRSQMSDVGGQTSEIACAAALDSFACRVYS
jgi:hypothetical protein